MERDTQALREIVLGVHGPAVDPLDYRGVHLDKPPETAMGDGRWLARGPDGRTVALAAQGIGDSAALAARLDELFELEPARDDRGED